MNCKWRLNRFRDPFGMLGVVVVWLMFQNLSFCWSLNDEGLALLRFRERIVSDPFGALKNWNVEDGEVDPCSWFGVECSDGKVVTLTLKDLCLGGTLSPELRNLVNLKSIILRNNSFTGIIPRGITELKELEVLDLGYNNFSGPLPVDFGSNYSLAILLLDNNRLLGISSPEMYAMEMFSQFQVDESQFSGATRDSACNSRPISRNVAQIEKSFHGRSLEGEPISSTPNIPSLMPPSTSSDMPESPRRGSPSASPTPEHASAPTSAPTPEPSAQPKLKPTSPPTTASSPPSASSPRLYFPVSPKEGSKHHVAIMAGAIGGGALLVIFVVGLYFFARGKVATVKPWATGLSGQLQKAFVTGIASFVMEKVDICVPNLKRSEIQAACEAFSNVIGTSPMGMVYKGTLSSGVEIAVASLAETSASGWCNSLEFQFRKKIETLSKVNHKNFVSLIGYCQEDKPFSRMMVFEYAPNGTLFEHLHIREAEHLDWRMRMRIAMGMAYCLEYMHQLKPPIAHNNLTSAAIQLTEDYAPKVSEFTFSNEIAEAEKQPSGTRLSNSQSTSLESNVYSFGVILFEIITGRLPYAVDNASAEDWASDYLKGEKHFKGMADPTLECFHEEQLERIGELIRDCVHPDPRQRPAIREVTARLREITGLTPEAATPKLSPLWWAELELMSADAS